MALEPVRPGVVAVAQVAVLGLAVGVVVATSGGGNPPQAGGGSRDAGGSATRAFSTVVESGEGAPVTEVAEAAGSRRGDRLPGLARTGSPEALDRLPALPPGARVLSRSRTGAGRTTQLTLVATTPDPGPAVLAHYRRVLGRHGLAGSPADAVPGATAERFARGRDVVVVTTARRGSATELTVFAALRTGSTPGRG